MRDGIRLAKLGKPAVVFVQDKFERAARAQATALGVPGLRIYVYPQYSPGGVSAALEEAKGVTAAREFPGLLVASVQSETCP